MRGIVFAVGLAGAGAAAWITYLRYKDRRRPEPLVLVLLLAGVGAASVGIALLGYDMLGAAGSPVSWDTLMGPLPRALPAALAIGLVEETAKLAPVLPIALFSRHFDELWDGPIYAGAAGVGFAAAESLALFAGGVSFGTEALARAAAAPITHALFAMPWGLGLSWWKLRGRGSALLLGLLASGALHGLYDLLLARPGLHLAAAGLVLALWLAVLATGRRLARARPAS